MSGIASQSLSKALLRPMHFVWAALVVLCAGFYVWWERPVAESSATLVLDLQVQGLPEGSRGALWTGPTRSWRADWDPGPEWLQEQGTRFAFGPRAVPFARRRFRQGFLLRRTGDLAVAVLEAPDHTRRYFIYDLRDDLASGLLGSGHPLSLQISCKWASLKGSAVLPGESDRLRVGY